jgi:hypothetical protein
VTLLDPWASHSFLLPGNNAIGAKARHRAGPQGQPLLDVSFEDFLRALRGSIEGFLPDATFAGLEALYPEMDQREEYLVWKYSRLLSTDSFQVSFMRVIELTARTDLERMPKLRLLAQWADDYIIGVLSGFSVPKPGTAADRKDIPTLRNDFILRLDQYAQSLPWTLKWLLLQRTKETEDRGLSLTILDSFLKFDPKDVDFQIARAETLLREGMIDEALSQLERSEEQWNSEVTRAINKPSAAEAEEFLFAKDYGLQSLAVLHWRYTRIALLRRIAQRLKGSPDTQDHDLAMESMQRKYVIGSLLIDFFPETMWAASLSRANASQETYLQSVMKLPNDDERLRHFALALYNLFSTKQSIGEVSDATRTALRRSTIGRELCAIKQQGRLVPGMVEQLTDELGGFCRKKAAKNVKTAPSGSSTIVQNALRFGSRTSRENAYCGSSFAFFLDREH